MEVIVLLAALATVPHGEPLRDEVTLIELNVVHDGYGKVILAQWVFYDGHAGDGEVRAWRLARGQPVERDYRRGGWVLRFTDQDELREVRAKHYRVWATLYDTEVFDRRFTPKENRKGLHGPQGR